MNMSVPIVIWMTREEITELLQATDTVDVVATVTTMVQSMLVLSRRHATLEAKEREVQREERDEVPDNSAAQHFARSMSYLAPPVPNK
jgi:uncharacterized protein (DUF4213/DUF364 family)